MTLALVCIAAVLLDALLGEPRRGHPLIAFGALAAIIEQRWNRGLATPGLLALAVLVLPPVVLVAGLWWWLPVPWRYLLDVLILWLALGRHSLAEHARAVVAPLLAGDLDRARQQVGRLVSRDTRALDETGVAAAATESVLENGADAVFASLFWYLVAGAPGVVLHRLVNTLDAMWGYRSARYECFGRGAARLDDMLGWLPARLVALSYALVGHTGQALRCWQTQARAWESPNAGPVMAAGAGALGVRLGGAAPYEGGWRTRPELGTGDRPDARTPVRAIRLMHGALLLWLACIVAGGFLWNLITAVA